MYEEFIMWLHMYAKAIGILAKGYLPISLIAQSKLHKILNQDKMAIQKTKPDYDIVIQRLHLYYDMKLVTSDIDRNKNPIIQFPVFIQSYTQQLLKVYQIETVPVLIVDQIKQTDSYMHLQIDMPYIALNSETYITFRQQELRTCKRIGYEFYCEVLFMVKHKYKYSHKSVIYFDLSPDIIKENCKFIFYFNKTYKTLKVFDRGNKIILANWPDDKHII